MERVTDQSVIEGYLTDASNRRGHAEVLIRPSTTAEVAEVVAHCQRAAIPLTITAGRTSTTAGPVPHGGWLLSMERLSAIEHIGHDTATAGAGIFLGEFQAAIEQKGRFFPPDPTSRHECTLGAAIACNASGARSFRYGPTRPWIEALEVVLPTGEVISVRSGDPIPSDWPMPAWSPPKVKHAAGYVPPRDLLDVFIGQEGTLGVITRATVRLTDLPPDVMGILAFFPDRATAIQFVETARAEARRDPRAPLSPRCLEYFDHQCLDLARQRGVEVPEGARAALFCEQETWTDDAEEVHLEAWWEALEAQGALADDTVVATDGPGRQRLHQLRHAIPAGINERVIHNGMPKLGTDLSVPDDGLVSMMDAYADAPIEHVLFGHIGDNHLHLNLLPKNDEELAVAKAFYDTLAKHAIALGGSVSAEHGIGKVKVEQFSWMLDASAAHSLTALKRRLDPAWILGRGNVIAYPEPAPADA
jgi:FAD/FMN-containing dehydrogenase